ncbi:MAG: hypothetical protein SVO01_00235 [Thermotogota bacterium]|nr:hypothetical protein [Thermotogota bacterium]
MAKSIYETLQTLETETSVPEITDKDGNIIRENMGMVKHTLPAEKLPTPEEFENEEKLLEWARQSGQLHQCLQSGVQARVVEYRAIFKAPPKKSDLDKGIKWSPEYGQANVDNAEWLVTKRPAGKKSKEDIAREYLDSLTPEERKAFFAGDK